MKRIILFLAFVYGCSSSSYDMEESLLSSFEISDSVSFVVLVPVEGCSTCKTEGLLFAKRNLHNPEIKIILTDLKSEKSTNIKVGELATSPAILRDIDNKFVKAGLVQYTPTVIYLTSGKVDKIITTSSESAVHELNTIEIKN